ncbi:hypothetical protein PSPO01_01196 [Paraphaeosphaeria sporulosa]
MAKLGLQSPKITAYLGERYFCPSRRITRGDAACLSRLILSPVVRLQCCWLNSRESMPAAWFCKSHESPGNGGSAPHYG